MRHLFTTVVALVCATAAISAAPKGVVVAPDKHPLAGVSVVTNLSGVGTQTDAAGMFTVPSAPSQPQASSPNVGEPIKWVTFSMVGYLPRQFATERIPDTVVLEPVAASGEQVIVTSDRAREGVTPLAYENFSQKDIKRDYKIGEFPTLLESTPNLYAHTDAGSGLGYSYMSIRGFDDKRVATYINGVPLNDPEDQATYFVDLPDFASTVTDIQVQRGVGNSLYGDASFGGSVNIVTNAFSRERSASIATGYGNVSVDGRYISDQSKQTINYSSGLIDGRWAFGGRFSKQYGSGYRYNSWYDGWSYYLSAARLDPHSTTELHVYGGPMRMHLAYLGATLDDIALDRRSNQLGYDNETDNFNQPHFQLHNVWSVSGKTTLSNTLYYIRGKGYYEQLKDKQYYSDYNIEQQFVDDSVPGVKYQAGEVVRQQWVYKNQVGWNPRLDIVHDHGCHSVGGSFYYFDSDHWGQVVWAEHVNSGVDPRQRYYEYHGKKYVASMYGQEIYNLTSKLTTQVTTQFRYQRYQFNQDIIGAFKGYDYDLDWFFVSPRIGATYRLSKSASIFANIAVSSRTPTDADIYDAGDPYAFPSLDVLSTSLATSGDTVYHFGDPTAKSERVYDFELGTKYRESKFSGGLDLFWMEFRNEIIPYGGVNANTGLPITVNADRSVHAGIELSIAATPTPRFTVSANAALNYNRIKKYDIDLPLYDDSYNQIGTTKVDASGKKITGFPQTLSNLIMDYNSKNFRATYRLRLVGKQYMELLNIDSLAIKGHEVSSISGEYRIPRFLNMGTLSLSLRVDNLFNQKFLTSGYGWNDGVQRTPSDPIRLEGGGEYFVNAERSFYTELKLEMF